MNVQKMRASRAQNADRMKAIVDTAEAEGRALTAEEKSEFDALRAQNDELKASIERAVVAEAEQAELAAVARPAVTRAAAAAPVAAPAKKEFESFGEFMHAAVMNQNDPRLQYESMDMGTGANGGFAVPEQFRAQLLQVTPQQATIRPRATVIEPGDPPDAKLTIPTLDQSQTAGRNIYGGVSVSWIGEGGEKPETNLYLKSVELEPKEVAGHIVVTDKLLRNWAAASSLIETQFRAAIIGAEEAAFFNGNGTGKPTGFLNAANTAALAVNRAAAGTITYADLVNMKAKFKGQTGVWIGGRSAEAQLSQLEDGSGRLIWSQDARGGVPSTLLGFDVIIDERHPIAVAAKGGLVLVDLSMYLIKDGSGPFIEASQHVHFTNNKTVVKAFWNVDAKPWLTAPILLESGETVSPFVLLDVPAG